MGKGDKKTAKGKRAQGSYGVTRKRKSATKNSQPAVKKVAKPTIEATEKEVKTPKTTAAKKATTEKKVAEKKPAAKKTTTKKATKKEE